MEELQMNELLVMAARKLLATQEDLKKAFPDRKEPDEFHAGTIFEYDGRKIAVNLVMRPLLLTGEKK